jgi:cytoskeleton protein RodZ
VANIGITLRSTRIQRGLTIEQVAQDTRISARFLEALENEEFDELPAPVYVRGFLRSYCNYLHLDPQPLLASLPGAQVTPPPAEIAPSAAPPLATPAPRQASDPFRPTPPARPRVISGEEPLRAAGPRRVDPFSPRRPEPETPLDSARTAANRGRVGGVLMERGAVYDGASRAPQIVAIVGGAFVVLVVVVLATMVFGRGNDGGGDSVLAGDDLTPKATKVGTVIVAGSATGQASPSVTAAGESVTPGASSTASDTPAGGTTPTSTPTATNGDTPTATSTPTQAPPTATSTSPPPRPTPTAPPPVHGSTFSECPEKAPGQPDCGSPMTVVCVAGTTEWFVDYGADFPKEQYGWPWAVVNTNGEAINAGQSGCA